MTHKMKSLLLQIGGVILALIWLFPFYIMVINSFKTKKELFTSTLAFPQVFVFDNYVKAFQALSFQVTLFNSLFITIVGVLVILIFASMAAYALQRTRTKMSGILFLIFLSAILIPFQVVMIPLVAFMAKLHLLLSRLGIIFIYLGFGASFAIFLCHGALQSIPTSLDEAATIDGCNPFQAFFLIILPMLKPIIVTVAILDTIWIWNDYLLPSLTINRDDLHTIPLKMFYFFGEYTKQWHLAMAGLTIAIIPVIIFYFIAQKQIIAGMTQGAVKQ